jgi:hypothetical protein
LIALLGRFELWRNKLQNFIEAVLIQAGVEPGVYFLFDEVKKEKPVYVGSSWNCFLGVADRTRKEFETVHKSLLFLR